MKNVFLFLVTIVSQQTMASDWSLVASTSCITDTHNYSLVIQSERCVAPQAQVVVIQAPSVQSQIAEFKQEIIARDEAIIKRMKQRFEKEDADFLSAHLGHICKVQSPDGYYMPYTTTNVRQSDIKKLNNGDLVGVLSVDEPMVGAFGENTNGVALEVIKKVPSKKHVLDAKVGDIVYDYQALSIGLSKTIRGALVDCVSVN